MSRQTPLSLPSLFSMFTVCEETNEDDLPLSQEIQTQTLSSHLQRFESGSECLHWTLLMEWFVEAVIGIDSIRIEHPTAPPLTFDNIRIDSYSTILITFPSSQQPSISGSLSSDISTLCEFFLRVHRTLEDRFRLLLPLDYNQPDVVFARIMDALVEHFVPSDPHHPNSSPEDLLPYFRECFHDIPETDDPFSETFRLHNLATSFTRFVLHPQNRSSLIPADHPLHCVDAGESSEQILDAVKKVKETQSMEVFRNDYFDWEEWVTMMEMVDQSVISLTDLSFLQSPCFHFTLESLQTKHQLRDKLPQLEEKSGFLSSSDETGQFITCPPFQLEMSINSTNVSSSAISTEISLPSELSSSDVPTHSSGQLVFSTHSIIRHSQHILSTIHSLKTRPRPDSFLWNLRPSILSESELDAHFQPSPHFIDQSETFEISLFDEIDDQKVVASLRRCRAVVEATQSTECVVDVKSFRSFLISGLHSSNFAVLLECYELFSQLLEIDTYIDDPHEDRFDSLRTAFREGTHFEMMTLLKLWARWFDFSSKIGDTSSMNMSDFDFSGFLATDLSNKWLFDEACVFLWSFLLTDIDLISFEWKMDFLLSFERKNQMMSRLSSDPSPSSDQERSRHFQSPLAITLGSYLSVFRGCDFPSALTERLTVDLHLDPVYFSRDVNPAFYLSYTSINPHHRHSFFPMDLMFERYLRSDPNAFFRYQPNPTLCPSSQFLYTPIIGLHSLLLRSPKLTLDSNAIILLVDMFFVDENQDDVQSEILALIDFYPPPRLIDTLLCKPHLSIDTPSSPAPLVRTSHIWIRFLTLFRAFSAFTTPFGACATLAEVFKMLAPFDSNPEENELSLLRDVGEIVVSLHWFSLPPNFDSPLLFHLPSLAGAQRGILQTLSSDSGIPSLVNPNPFDSFEKNVNTVIFEELSIYTQIHLLSQCLSNLNPSCFNSSIIEPLFMKFLNVNLLSRFPAIASIAFEVFHRLICVSSDADRMTLVRLGLLDHVVFAVSNSPFLDDYEKGIAVIGTLLDAIQRDHQTQRLRTFDFHRHLNAGGMTLTECEEKSEIEDISQDFGYLEQQIHQLVKHGFC